MSFHVVELTVLVNTQARKPDSNGDCLVAGDKEARQGALSSWGLEQYYLSILNTRLGFYCRAHYSDVLSCNL